MRPSLSGSDPFQAAVGWYGFAGANLRIVARDLFLDGNTVRDSRRVTKRAAEAEGQLGFAVIYKKFRVSYTFVSRIREFIGQREPDQFAGVAVTFRNDPS